MTKLPKFWLCNFTNGSPNPSWWLYWVQSWVLSAWFGSTALELWENLGPVLLFGSLQLVLCCPLQALRWAASVWSLRNTKIHLMVLGLVYWSTVSPCRKVRCSGSDSARNKLSVKKNSRPPGSREQTVPDGSDRLASAVGGRPVQHEQWSRNRSRMFLVSMCFISW